MFKKKMAALMAVLLMTITICSTAELPVVGANTTYAEEKTNLVMENEKLRSVQTIAGEKVHMTVELRLKDGYCSEPEFHLPNPSPVIGPIRGEISMAPMMTGMELTLSPTLAMMIATKRIYTLGPRNGIFERISSIAA